MAEKVIQEVRIVETDDGFRIEIKGDKERLRQMALSHQREMIAIYRQESSEGLISKVELFDKEEALRQQEHIAALAGAALVLAGIVARFSKTGGSA